MSDSSLYRVDIVERQQTQLLDSLTIGYEWEISDPAPYAGEWERGIYRGPIPLNGEPLCMTVIESSAAEAVLAAVAYVSAMKEATQRAMKNMATKTLAANLRMGLMA